MLDMLRGLPPGPLLLVVAAILAAESGLLIGVFLPGAGLVLATGFTAGLGSTPLVTVVAVVATATAVGSQTRYLRVRWAAARPAGRRFAARPRVRRELIWVTALLRRHPAVTIAAAHLLGGVRTLTPGIAAWSGMRYARFAAADLPAALLWAGVLTTVGFEAGEAYDRVTATAAVLGVTGQAAVVTALLLTRRLLLRRGAEAAGAAP